MATERNWRDEWERYDAATAELDPPFAIVDVGAFDANAADLVRRADGRPVRLATKSVRVRSLLRRALATDGFDGVMTYSLHEAEWLVRDGFENVLMAYPTVDRSALAALANDETLASTITLMVDDIAHLDLIDDVCGTRRPEIRLCLDLDTSWRPFGMVVGARRSPVRTKGHAIRLARTVVDRPGFRLVGVMTYEAQIAGVVDSNPLVGWMKRRSADDIEQRRSEILRALAELATLEFVNAGGTGSLETSATGTGVTEVTAGSGLFGPGLFDGYRTFRPRPSALFALSVVRRPGPGVATVFAGGYVASGPVGRSRLPVPYLPAGLRLTRTEAAGEVQTPLVGAVADELSIGGRVWLRHAKAGELCEHFDVVHLVENDRVIDTVPTYRGEGRAFG